MTVVKSTISRDPCRALPQYAVCGRNGTVSFWAGRGARTRLPKDPTTPAFRAAYNAALVDAIAMEDDSDDWTQLQRHHAIQDAKRHQGGRQ